MNRIFYKLILLLAISVHPSCSNSADKQKRIMLREEISDLNIKSDFSDKNVSVIVIIPRSGCSGCIGMADYFFKTEGAGNEQIQFIFTKISSMKELHAKIDKDLLSLSNVFLDKEDSFCRGPLDSIYPTIAFVNNGEIQQIDYLSPSNEDIIYEMRNRIIIN